MTFELQAAEAARLARDLTDDELFVLMASEGMGKGARVRAFHEDSLRKPSVERQLREGSDVRSVLKSLAKKGFLDGRGRKKYEASSPGNTVKHAFDDLRDDMILQSPNPLDKASREWIPILRDRMDDLAKDCE